MEPYRVGDDVQVLPSHMRVPGVGAIPINAFVLHAEQPVLVDTGLGVDGPEFVEALRSVLDPEDLRWIWLTHDDADHTGSLEAVMAAAPSAQLVCHGLAALRMKTWWEVPLDRVRAMGPGDRLDVGDRELHAVRPPTFDNPMSIGCFDDRTATLFAVDSFGAILPTPVDDLADIAEGDLVAGMVAWTTFDSPWLHLSDGAKLAEVLDNVRRLAPRRILSSHLPPAVDRLESFLDVIAAIPAAEPFIAPDADAFNEIVANLVVHT